MPPPAALAGLPRITPPTTLAARIPLTSGGTLGTRLGTLPVPSLTSPSSSGDSASAITNLLPMAHYSLHRSTEGVYVGDGIPPVPEKIAAKIRKGEFVEMGELLPEFWSPREDGDSGRETKARRSRKVTDTFTWLQCFGVYVSVRTLSAPSLIPELMAYMSTIVRVSQDFSGLAWVRYDAAFRRQAALTRNDRWSVINSTLYTMCFTGMASTTKRCELCFASTHTELECAQRGDPDPGMKDRLKAIETAVLALTGRQDQTIKPPLPATKPSGEPCRKWNSVGCTFPRCRHLHVCSSCWGSHPASKCTMRPSYQGQGTTFRGGTSPGKQFPPPSKPS